MKNIVAFVVGLASLALGCVGGALAQPSALLECRDMTAQAEGGAYKVRMCRGADGTWQRVQQIVGGGNGAPAFRGQIAYEGQMKGSLARVTRQQPQLDLRNLQRTLRQIGQNATANRAQELAGPISLTLEFDGTRVAGSYRISGGVTGGTLQGTVEDGFCRLTDSRTGGQLTGRCGMQEISGTFRSADNANPRVQFQFAATSRSTTDYDARDRRRAADAAAIRVKQQADAAAEARLLASVKQDAANGNVDAMLALAYMYRNGEHVAQNYGEAMRWYKTAAARGSTSAMYSIGFMYYEGLGAEKNAVQSQAWHLRCAQAGSDKWSVNCAASIAENYDQGFGVVIDKDQAVRWYRVCAVAGKESCINWLNEHGIGLRQTPTAGKRRKIGEVFD